MTGTLDKRKFFASNLSLRANRMRSTVGEEGRRNTFVTFTDYAMEAYGSHNHSRNFKWEAGMRLDGFKTHDLIRSSSDQEALITAEMLNGQALGIFSRSTYDNLDDAWFATRGLRARWDMDARWNAFDNKAVWSSTSLSIECYCPVRENLTFIPQFYGRAIIGDNASISRRYCNFVGGAVQSQIIEQQMPFIGLNRIEKVGNVAGIFRTDLRWKTFGQWYFSLLSNWCHSFDTQTDILGVGVRASYHSILGPMSAELHWSTLTQGPGIYLSFGFNF